MYGEIMAHKKIDLRINRPTEPLPIVVRDKIAGLIEEGVLTPGDRMPIEPELAREFGVGRGTLREALRLLEEDGYISRQVGIGTFVKKSRPATAAISLEKNFGVLELLESMNLKPSHIECHTRVIKADKGTSDILQVKAGTSLVFISRVATVGPKRVVCGMNILPKSILKYVSVKNFKGSLHTLLEEQCGQKIAYGIAKIISTVADISLSKKLEIDRGCPLLLIEQINYDPENKPVLLSREYWVQGVVELTIFRDHRK